MSWVDSMRLRRKADHVRSVGWFNLIGTTAYVIMNASDASAILLPACLWAAFVMVLGYAVGWLVDRRADRVVGQ